MPIRLEVIAPERCAVCGKPIHNRKGRPIVFFLNPGVVGASWHATCGPLPHIEGLTVKAPKK